MTNGERDASDCVLYGCDYGDRATQEGLQRACVVCGQPEPRPAPSRGRSWLSDALDAVKAIEKALK
jgi:hypothetical protein